MLTNPKRLAYHSRRFVAAFAAALLLTACAGLKSEADYTDDLPGAKNRPDHTGKAPQSIFGPGGLALFGGDEQEPAAGVSIPVNSYLWRASLDTLSFMPLSSADPFGGVIITDWFTPPESANERFKMTVYILSRDLRADGLTVAVFRQVNDGQGNWVDDGVSADTASELENAILTRARELRIAGLAY